MHNSPNRSAASSWDVVIVGAGPAGLSAALILGRCCRSVLIYDRGTPRSWASKAMHGFITRDGMHPMDFAAAARSELDRYSNVSLRSVEVQHITPEAGGFIVAADGERVQARKVLIATGVLDQLPAIDGIEALFGISVFQCPYCDGWEFRDRPVAVYGRRNRGFEMARALTAWTRDIMLCTDGPCGLSKDQRQQLTRNGIQLQQARIARLVAHDGVLSAIAFNDASTVARDALFFDMPCHGQSSLTHELGCRFKKHGGVQCGQYEATSVPGVYVAGNIIRNVQLAIVAAAEGANAAFGINRALTREDFELRATGQQHIEHTAPTLQSINQ